MNRRDYLVVLIIIGFGGYSVVSELMSDRPMGDATIEPFSSVSPDGYGAEGYGTGGYGE